MLRRALLATLLLAAPPAFAGDAQATAQVSIDNFTFAPDVLTIARGTKVLPARLARRALVTTFGRPGDAYPSPEYQTRRTHADYVALVTSATSSERQVGQAYER